MWPGRSDEDDGRLYRRVYPVREQQIDWETWRWKVESELLGEMQPATVKFSFILGGMFVANLTLGRRRVGVIRNSFLHSASHSLLLQIASLLA